MSVVAIVGWKFNRDELIDAYHCQTVSEFEEIMYILWKEYSFWSVDDDYTNVVFGIYDTLCDNWTLNPINLESFYDWYKSAKHNVMLYSKHYLPHSLRTRTCGKEPKLYFISDGE